MKNERLTWIDGLRGLACILIFTHHFLVFFFLPVITEIQTPHE